MRRTPTTRATTRARAVIAVALLACLCLTGCTGSSGGSSAGADGGAVAASDARGDESAVNAMQDSAAEGTRERPPLREPAVIATGAVAVTADDVTAARTAAERVAERHGGHLTDAQTSTDDGGDVESAHLVLRVPAAAFAEVIAAVEKVGTLVESSTTSEDVTQQVVDTEARVASARASIDRLRLLLSRAEKLGDVISVETELARREADLDSLLQQQAYLADQTSLSTITLSIERSGSGAAASDDAGFLTGLGAGWEALAGFAVGLATVLGVLVPWTPVIALVGVPLWLLLRRRRAATEPAGT